MTSFTIDDTLLTPPMPPMANPDIDGLGVIRRLKHNAFEAFPERCWQESMVWLDTPLRPVLIAATPESIRQVMLENHPDYERSMAGKRVWGPLAGNGLATSEGETWRSQRRTMAPAFTPQKIQALTGLIVDSAERACVQLERQRGQPANLLDFCESTIMDMAATVMFSSDVSKFGHELRHLLTIYMTRIGGASASEALLPAWVPTFSTARRALFRRSWRRMMERVVANRRAEHRATAGETTRIIGRRTDLFDLLDQAHTSGRDDLLRDEVSTMLAAGTQTTALSVFWACVLLARSPHIQSDLVREAAAFDWNTIDSSGVDLTRFPLTKAVVMETLRLYTPGFMTQRRAIRANQVCGREVPTGATIIIPFWLLHRDPNRWASAASFVPQRFIEGAQPERFDYLPFGIGPHVCIGAQLATAEITILLARLLRDNRIEPIDRDIPVPVGRVATQPSFNPRFSVTPR
ncbi:hypothetical protein WK60_09190 [Burkholderia ubonensis]|uniref:cytochrome P450 n=1 Tax=Burkholderia ubonensis TaxID=101571 RepID=UPI0007532203|nr:cytochrome P450 [Burkholderia ubonensis]KVT96178.1 hypothetical protein WK60_09190 [Burkholderia ubonensis]